MKRGISLILAAAVLFLLLPAAAFAEEAQTTSARATPIGTWSWYSATEFAGGVGSSEDPFLISTPEQLAHINVASVTDKTYFSLTNDIDLSAHYWKSGMRFQGHFRGNGYTITGLNIQEYHLYSEASGSYFSGNAGLFSYISAGATICDLNIQNPVVAVNGDSAYSGGNQYAGVVAGYCDGTITNVNVTGASVTRSGTGSGSNYVGGIVGRGGNLTGCRFSGTVRNTDAAAYAVGGIAGLCAKGISSCTSSGSIEASNAAAAGGIAGELQGCSTCHDSYQDTFVDKLQGIRGDMNGDILVDGRDAVYLLRHVLSPGKYPLNQSGDMNGDAVVNETDAIRLLRYALVPSRYPLHTD